MSTADGTASTRDRDTIDSMSLILSGFPATPTPLARKRVEDSRKKDKDKKITIHTDVMNKENRMSKSTPTMTTATASADRPVPAPRAGTQKEAQVMSRSRARAELNTSTSGKGSYSIMPPVAGRRRGNSSVSNSALGLGIEGVNVPSIVVTPNENGERSDDKMAKRQREKKIVERGRYEKLPR